MMTPLCQRWSRPESWIPSPAREEFPPWRRSQKASNLPVWMFKTLINNFLLPRIPGIFTSLVRAEKFLISINARWGSLTLTEHRRHRGLDMTRLGEDKLHVTRLHLSWPVSLQSLSSGRSVALLTVRVPTCCPHWRSSDLQTFQLYSREG